MARAEMIESFYLYRTAGWYIHVVFHALMCGGGFGTCRLADVASSLLVRGACHTIGILGFSKLAL